MKYYLYIVMILNLLGCGTDDRRNKYVTQYSEATSNVNGYGAYGVYVNEFKDMVESWTGIRPIDRLEGIAFRTVSMPNIWATCKTTYADSAGKVISTAVIELDPNMRGMSEELFKITIWHELGHCIENSHHIQDVNDLMNPYTLKGVIEPETDLRTINYMQRLSEGRNS